MSPIGKLEFVFLLLLLFIVVFGFLARRIGTPYAIVMVIGGFLISLVPGIPKITLNPDVVFLVVLPPLLYAAAWTTSWRDFRYNLVSISLLAFGLVGFTVAVVAVVAPRIFDGFDWRLGVVLGAVVAPTDAIAATSIARRVGLPRRLVDILEGESLINDATGLLALQFGTAMVVESRVPTVLNGLSTLVWLTAGGIMLGLLVGWVVDWIERQINDAPIEITLSILVPYAAYLAAEAVHASGVLAVVACGLFLARRSARFFSPSVRIQIWSVWESLNFVLNGFVFVLIGLQLPSIRASIGGHNPWELLAGAGVFTAILIAVRLVWVYPAATLAWVLRTHAMHQREKRPNLRGVFVLGWTGMRGVVSLAAALALPAILPDGNPFPQRNVIVFLTFSVIFATLVLQGVTLPRLIRALRLAGTAGGNCEEIEARRIVLDAAVDYLKDASAQDTGSADVYADLIRHYEERLATIRPEGDGGQDATKHDRYVELSLEALRVERDTAIALRDEGRISDEVLRHIERELDLNQTRLDGAGEA
ncbi:MAG TPA: Na+/H+ antiporter [Bryobacteraceae bacterium]|nr:Na+/H+ antiporter [Bryobacteraceae bacterium]